MPNLASLYTSLTTLPKETDKEVKPVIEPEEDAGHFQLRQNWLSSTITREHFTDLESAEKGLIDLCVRLACNYPQTNNHQQIINHLVRVDSIRKIKEGYARTR